MILLKHADGSHKEQGRNGRAIVHNESNDNDRPSKSEMEVVFGSSERKWSIVGRSGVVLCERSICGSWVVPTENLKASCGS